MLNLIVSDLVVAITVQWFLYTPHWITIPRNYTKFTNIILLFI